MGVSFVPWFEFCSGVLAIEKEWHPVKKMLLILRIPNFEPYKITMVFYFQ